MTRTQVVSNVTRSEKTLVIFRVFKNGDVIALFPDIPATYNGISCQSYTHTGQRGISNVNVVMNQTKSAEPHQYESLEEELRNIGYDVLVTRRIPTDSASIRMRVAAQAMQRAMQQAA